VGDPNKSAMLRRLIGYPVAVLAVAGLVRVGFFHGIGADPQMLLEMSSVHLQLGRKLAGTDRAAAMVAEAEELIDRAERGGAEPWAVLRARGEVAYFEGDFLRAAEALGAARAHESCPSESMIDLALGECELRLLGGDPDGAIAVLSRAGADRWEGDRHVAREVVRVRALQQKGDVEGCVAVIEAAHDKGTFGELEVARLYEEVGAVELAEAAYDSAARDEPVTNYYLGRLKLRQGEVDSALRLLERSLREASEEARSLVERDRALWEERGGDRFQQTMQNRLVPGSELAAPGH
jgi:tetratricopeptide (TPR) repeat protein